MVVSIRRVQKTTRIGGQGICLCCPLTDSQDNSIDDRIKLDAIDDRHSIDAQSIHGKFMGNSWH